MSLLKQQQAVSVRRETKRASDRSKKNYALLTTSKQGAIDHLPGGIDTAEMAAQLDIGTKARAFSLQLERGPYQVRYTPSGGSLLCVGQQDVVGVDTVTLFPRCERDIGDTIHDGAFLHRGTFFALAQSECVYIYDHHGVEVHALREHRRAHRVTYLQDHFLLGTLTPTGRLRYQDTTIGKLVSEIDTKQHSRVLEHDRTNGVVYLGSSSGEVSLWSPRSADYLAKMLAHSSRVSHLQVSDSGRQLATAAGNELAVWDIRNTFAPLSSKRFPGQLTALALSQTGQLAVSQKNQVAILNSALSPVVTHQLGRRRAHSLRFMPYEDILTIGTSAGMENIVAPGAGESVYRRHENPRVSKREQRNAEVRRLLEKIPADLIALENEVGTEVKELFTEKIVPMKIETPAGKVRRLMRMHYG